MQNKHQFFFLVLGVPTLGEGGGVDLVGPNSQIFPKIRFEGFPKLCQCFTLRMCATEVSLFRDCYGNTFSFILEKTFSDCLIFGLGANWRLTAERAVPWEP